MTLDQYFHLIVKQPIKEPLTMFERTKAYWQSVKDSWNNLHSWEEPVPRTKAYEEIHAELEQAKKDLSVSSKTQDYYHFEMYTAPWYNDEEEQVEGATYSNITGDHVDDGDPSWSTALDKILDEMSKHYGYDIKSQVYYVVDFPMNESYPNKRGRMLNAEVLDQVSLAFPEIFERHPKWNEPKNIFA